MRKYFIPIILILVLSGCAHNEQAIEPEQPLASSRLTVGLVQKEIKKGMTQADVASTLGSPNIVSSTEIGRETWIYDKLNTSATYSNSESYGTVLIIGGSSSRQATSYSQQTLTVIIKFKEGIVDEYKYHSSKF